MGFGLRFNKGVYLLVGLAMLSGCSSSEDRGAAAYARYEAAAARNDLVSARQALLQAVAAKDDVALYWLELGKLHAALGDFAEAYRAFARAQELNRSDVDLIRTLTELALRLGDLIVAKEHARQLDIVSPGDRWVKLVDGYASLEENNFTAALATSDDLLAILPFDSLAVGLKARSLLGLAREQEAIELLRPQVRSQPTDVGSWLLLSRVYQRGNDWPAVAETANRLMKLKPQDDQIKLLFIEASLRSHRVPAARETSLQLLHSGASPEIIVDVLDHWLRFWSSRERVAVASRIASNAPALAQRVAFADFLTKAGDPNAALGVIGDRARFPITAENADAHSVVASALAAKGDPTTASERFNKVLEFDSGNPLALEGRAELLLRHFSAHLAVADAQKLIVVRPDSAADRILLARCFAATGSSREAERVLWTAFQDIPADERIYEALAAHRKGNSEALRSLEAEFQRQRDAKLNRGLL